MAKQTQNWRVRRLGEWGANIARISMMKGLMSLLCTMSPSERAQELATKLEQRIEELARLSQLADISHLVVNRRRCGCEHFPRLWMAATSSASGKVFINCATLVHKSRWT